jgi:hypothetical protein
MTKTQGALAFVGTALAITAFVIGIAYAAQLGRWAGTPTGLVFLAVFGVVGLTVAHRADRGQ